MGSREVGEHVAVRNPLEVARAVVRWREPDYEDIKGVGGKGASGWAGFGAALVQGMTENEDETWGDYDIPWDILGPIDEALNVERGMPPW